MATAGQERSFENVGNQTNWIWIEQIDVRSEQRDEHSRADLGSAFKFTKAIGIRAVGHRRRLVVRSEDLESSRGSPPAVSDCKLSWI